MNTAFTLHQASFPGMCPITEATTKLADSGDVESRGAFYTKREVVEFILDLVGYTADKKLQNFSLLEPSFGGGDFLQPVIDRLLAARSQAMQDGYPAPPLDNCIRAVELHRPTFESTRRKVLTQLITAGIHEKETVRLVNAWLIQDDFLLTTLPECFEWVVGNPPYVRQELVPTALLNEYRNRYPTLYDRADLYIPFIERSLRLLSTGGQLGFICADRWTKNRYGGPLRALIAQEFHLRAYVDMADTQAFHSEVIAYPAITIIARSAAGPTLVMNNPKLETVHLRNLSDSLTSVGSSLPSDVHRIELVGRNDEPWVLQPVATTDLVRRIEANFPTLEEAGCKVGIGVATGADQAFIDQFDMLDVEADRKLPLVTTRDIVTGFVQWSGKGVINPFTDQGPLVDLASYPRLSKYLEARRELIEGRHVAKKDPTRWYRTIDRITPSLARRPKLLIPDIKGDAQVVFEPGQLYPHHNLYYVVSDNWDLHALQAVLLSSLTRLFISTYSTKMRGGYLRFQAQYLRRIRLPHWELVEASLRTRLIAAARRLDLDACNETVCELYKITALEKSILNKK